MQREAAEQAHADAVNALLAEERALKREEREEAKEDPVKKCQRRTAEVMRHLQNSREYVPKFMWATQRSPGVPSQREPWRPADLNDASVMRKGRSKKVVSVTGNGAGGSLEWRAVLRGRRETKKKWPGECGARARRCDDIRLIRAE